MTGRPHVDFSGIAQRVTMEMAVQYLGLTQIERKGDQVRYQCPACKGNRDLSVNLAEGLFKCFSWGKGGTDSIALVAHVKGTRQREAAVMLDEHFPAPRATSPAQAEPGGRRESDADNRMTSHPVAEMLGLSAATLEAMGATEGERLVIPLRKADGVQIGTLGIATRADQVPLLDFRFDEHALAKAKPAPDDLRKLFRIVG